MVVPRIRHLYFKSEILVLESKRAFWKSRTADAEISENCNLDKRCVTPAGFP